MAQSIRKNSLAYNGSQTVDLCVSLVDDRVRPNALNKAMYITYAALVLNRISATRRWEPRDGVLRL